MGSDFSQQICCVTCWRCKKQEAEEAFEETSETKPILQTSGETSIRVDKQPPTQVPEASERGPEEVESLCWDHRLLAGIAKDSGETCPDAEPVGMTEGQKAAWDFADFFVASAVMDTKGEAEVLTQLENQQKREKAGNTEEMKTIPQASEAQPVLHTAQDVKLIADKGQFGEQAETGSEDAPCAEITLQETDIPKLKQTTGETAAGPGCEIQPPAETGESLMGRDLSLYAVLTAEETGTYPPAEHTEETEGAKPAETSPQSAERAKLMCLSETASLPTVQATQKAKETADPSEVVPKDMSEMQFTSAISYECLYTGGKFLEPANQLLDFSWQEIQPSVLTVQEVRSHCSTEPAEVGEVVGPSGDQDRVVCDLVEDEEVTECDPKTPAAEAGQQQRVMQQITDEPLPRTEIAVEEEAECPDVAPLLSEVRGVQ
ncbi:uncharacterized protein LOC112982682 [Dromaius novaehollandiae]|uniref:uncharacterized protein LOC112982682 n=1 Tax=Dromaius novaehollandiae TaxID=8790 RepID=UPI00311DCA97